MTTDTPSPPDPVPRFLSLFLIALAIRLLVFVIGLVIATRSPPQEPPEAVQGYQYQWIDPGAAWPVEPWYRHDALWLVHVAREGYAGAEGRDGQHGAAFLPLLPAILALAGYLGLNIYWVGAAVPNVAAAAGMAVFARLAAKLTGDRATAIRAFVLLNAFSSAFFFSAPYQESLGLLFTALTLNSWIEKRPVSAGVFAMFGCLARLTGATIGAAAVLAWLVERPRTREGFGRAACVAGGCAVGVLIGWGVLWYTVGDPFLGMTAHAAWGRLPPSLVNIPRAFATVGNPESPQYFAMAHVLLIAACGVLAWVKRGTFWGLVAILPAIQLTLSGTFLSGHRVILASLPGFIELAVLLRPRLVFGVALALFVSVQLVLIRIYILGRFAG